MGGFILDVILTSLIFLSVSVILFNRIKRLRTQGGPKELKLYILVLIALTVIAAIIVALQFSREHAGIMRSHSPF